MKKTKSWKIGIAAGLAFVATLGGLLVRTSYTSADTTPTTQAASSLWETPSGITLQDNVDVPDYMKYGKYATSYGSSTVSPVLKEVRTDEEQNLEPWETNGLKITSGVDKKSFTYKNTVDISDFTTEDEFLTFTPLASSRGSYDYTEIQLTLQDADDEDNYLKITVKYNKWYWAGVMISAETPNVPAAGYRWGSATSDVGSSVSDRVYIGAFQGYTRDYNGGDKDTDTRHRPIKLRYDTEKKLVSINCQAGETYAVLDLDDGHSVGYGNSWKGFTNNRVKLSVAMSGFVSEKAEMIFLNVFGQGMNGATLTDNTAPTFSFTQDLERIPVAQVGKAYPVYDMQALDVVSGNTPHACTVLSPSGEKTTIEGDGFTPTQGGYYTLTYSSTDAAGNKQEQSFKIFATSGLSPITLSAEKATGAFSAGERIPVYEASAQGGSGNVTVETKVIRVGGGENVEIKDGAFTPILGGKYSVLYTATDYLGNTATKALEYEVATTQGVVVESITELKRVYDGVAVKFPRPIAYDYATRTGVKLNAKYEIAVYDAQNNKEVLADGVFVPSAEKYGDSVKVEYTVYANNAPSKENAVTHTYEVELFSKVEQVEDYFVYDKNVFTTTYNVDNDAGFIKFTTEQPSASQTISFVNAVRKEKLRLDFALPAGEQNYGALTISLRDSENANIGFDLDIIDMTTGVDKSVMTYVRSGGVYYAMDGTGNTFNNKGEEIASKTPLSLKYIEGQILDYNNNVVCTPSVNFDGSVFEGFTSDRVYISFTFRDVSGKSSVTLTQISTQTLYAEYDGTGKLISFTDIIAPTIVLKTDVKDKYYLGDKVEIPAATGYDVLSPYTNAYVTVRAAGKTVYDKVLATEGLSFEITSQGKYTITYETEDSSDNGSRKMYTITARDEVEPTITLNAQSLSCKVGESVAIPQAVVQDNMDASPRLYVMLILPTGELTVLGERAADNAVAAHTFTEKGTYYIRYYAFDAANNVAIRDIPVVVS